MRRSRPWQPRKPWLRPARRPWRLASCASCQKRPLPLTA
jgi:hypothetical protein